jgi:4'-phosphopantetheinyl transferase
MTNSHGGARPRTPLPPPGVIHLWSDRSAGEEHSDLPAESLSDEELARAKRIQNPEGRRSWVATRLFLRQVLARYAAGDPAALNFARRTSGKPYLPDWPAPVPPPFFSVSHTTDATLVAVSTTCEIGVDIEFVRDLPEVDALAERYLAADEAAWVQSEDGIRGRSTLFHRVWARKEAVLKALGTGLSVPLSSFSVIGAGEGAGADPGAGAGTLDTEADAGAVDGASPRARVWAEETPVRVGSNLFQGGVRVVFVHELPLPHSHAGAVASLERVLEVVAPEQ